MGIFYVLCCARLVLKPQASPKYINLIWGGRGLRCGGGADTIAHFLVDLLCKIAGGLYVSIVN